MNVKIHLIYLAAGSARRFGSNKLLYEFDGKPLFRYGLETLNAVVSRRDNCTLTVVSRYNEILTAAKELGISAQYCGESVNGMSHSIRCGIRSIKNLSPDDYLLFMVADQPYISAETIHRLLNKAQDKPLTACVCFGERAGNPAMFSASLAGELCALTGDQGGRVVIRNHPGTCVPVSCNDEWELKDIDTPEGIKI